MNPSNDEDHQMEASRLTSTCPLCFIIFCDKFTRNRHIRIVHEDQPKVENNLTDLPKNEVKCPQCKKMFKHGISLRRHIKQHETNSETFICSDCSKKFTRKDNLFKHRERIHKLYNIHLPAARAKFKESSLCDICCVDFGSDCKRFESHLISRSCNKKQEEVHLNSQDRFQCNFCEKSYVDKDSWRRHFEWKHRTTKPREFKCAQCQVNFAYESSLVRHVRKSHAGDKSS